MNTLLNSQLKQFDAKHGGAPVRVGEQGGWVLFATGAAREINPLGARREPNTFSPLELAKNIAQYRTIVVEELVKRFDKLKAVILANEDLADDFACGREVPQLVELKAIQKQIKAARKSHEAAQLAVDKLDPAYVSPEEQARRQAEEDEMEERRAAFFGLVDRIKV